MNPMRNVANFEEAVTSIASLKEALIGIADLKTQSGLMRSEDMVWVEILLTHI